MNSTITRDRPGNPACAQHYHEAQGGMRPGIPLSIGHPAQPQLAWMIEVDRRRGTFGLHVGAGRPGPCHLATSVWLDPDAAEAVAHALLEAVATWRAEQAVIAWTGAPV